MKLNKLERFQMSNQLRILEALYPDEAPAFRKQREAFEHGYELHYDWYLQNICPDEEVMTPEESNEVLDILQMFSAIHFARERMNLPSLVHQADALEYRGFSATDEGRQLAYAGYIRELDGGRYRELGESTAISSDAPMQAQYRRQRAAYLQSANMENLGAADLERIALAANGEGDGASPLHSSREAEVGSSV